MDYVLFYRLVDFMKAGATSLGLPSGSVSGDTGMIVVEDTGISIVWQKDVPGKGSAWEIRETYHATDLVTGASRNVVRAIGHVGAQDIYAAAKTALLAVAERGIDSAMGEVAAR